MRRRRVWNSGDQSRFGSRWPAATEDHRLPWLEPKLQQQEVHVAWLPVRKASRPPPLLSGRRGGIERIVEGQSAAPSGDRQIAGTLPSRGLFWSDVLHEAVLRALSGT